MSLDLSKLADYTRPSSQDHLEKTIYEADTVKFVSSNGTMMVGIKNEEEIAFLDGTIEVQSGDQCARTFGGSTSFDVGKIAVTPLKFEETFCPKKFEKKWLNEQLRAGQDPYTEVLYANQIMDLKSRLIALANEDLIWNGSKESVNPNLNKIDGFRVLYGSANVKALPAGATLTEKLQNALLQVDTSVKNSPDFFILMSHESLAQLNIEMARGNWYHQGEETKLFGTSARIIALKGLQDTGEFWFLRSRSLVIGTDLTGEIQGEGALMEYLQHTREIALSFFWALGVQLIFKNEIYVYSSKVVAPEEGGE